MDDNDQLRDIGQKLATALMQSYGVALQTAQLVFLPAGVTVPNGLVQSGLLNPTQMQTWLSINFDAPFSVSPGNGLILQKDTSHGSASRIYEMAATAALPVAAAGSDAWSRITAEIAAARRSLGPTNTVKQVVCEPDDWPIAQVNGPYWTKFDSSQTTTATTSTSVTVPVVNPNHWRVSNFTVPHAISDPGFVPVKRHGPILLMKTGPVQGIAEMLSPTALTVSPASSWHTQAAAGFIADQIRTDSLLQSVQAVQTTSSSVSSGITIHLEHQCVSLGYYAGGQPWWDGVFLADKGWCVPGMPLGGLLPAATGTSDAVFGLPVAFVVVQNLRVSGVWSAEDTVALSAPGGTVGPLSLMGASAQTEADGVTVTYSRDGMQVVALMCSPLPVLPPVDDPDLPPPIPNPPIDSTSVPPT